MNAALNSIFDRLDQHTGSVPLEELVHELRAHDLTPDDFLAQIHFTDDTYCRNLVRKTDAYEALVLCWRPGQRSPIHDHVGSRCGFRILKGRATEAVYESGSDGNLVSTVSHEYMPGDVCGSQDRDIHEIINATSDDLITLHVYTPPLADINLYDRVGGFVKSGRAPVNLNGSH